MSVNSHDSLADSGEIRNSANVQVLRNLQYLVADRPRTSRSENSCIIRALNQHQQLMQYE